VAENSSLPNKVLIVDDDPSVASGLEHSLAKHKVQVLKASDLESATYLFNQNRLDVVLVEIDFGPLPGLALVQKWRNHDTLEKRFTGFVMLSSGAQRLAGHDGLLKEMGDLELIQKPINPISLLPMLSRALASKQKQLAFHQMREKVVEPLLKAGDVDKAIDRIQSVVAEVGERGKRVVF